MQVIQLSNLAHIALLKALGYSPIDVKLNINQKVTFVFPLECRKFLVDPPDAKLLSIKEYVRAYEEVRGIQKQAIEQELIKRVKLLRTPEEHRALMDFKANLNKQTEAQSTETQENPEESNG